MSLNCHGRGAVGWNVLAGLALAFSPAGVCADEAESAQWLEAQSGNWDDAARWSTDVYPDNSPEQQRFFDALIDAAGAAYLVLLNRNVTLNSLSVNAAGATLNHQGIDLTVHGRLDVHAGSYIMRGGSIANAAIATGSGGLLTVETGSLRGVSLEGDLTLRNTPFADGILTLHHQTALAGGTIRLAGQSRPAQLLVNSFPDAPVIAGAGQIIFDGNEAAGAGFTQGIAQIVAQAAGSYTMTIEPGIAIRTGTSSGTIRTSSPGGRILNQGLISAETANRSIRIDGLTFHNEGTLQAINGGSLTVNNLIGAAGEVILGQGSSITFTAGSEGFVFDQGGEYSGAGTSLSLFGAAHVTAPLTVRDSARLSLTGNWTTSAAISAVDNATLEIGGALFDPGLVQSANAHIVIAGPDALSGEALAAIDHGGNRLTIGTGSFGTRGLLLNHDRQLDLANWQADVMIRNGTITGGEVVSSDGSGLRVEGIFTAMETVLDAAVDLSAGASLIVNVSTGQPQPSVIRGAVRGLTGGASVHLNPDSHNEGTIELVNGSLTTRGQWSNTGTISLRGGSFDMGGVAGALGSISLEALDFFIRSSITTEQLRSIEMSNVTMYLTRDTGFPVELRTVGELINTGDTFDINQQTGRLRLDGGRIIGGTLLTSDGTVLKREAGADPTSFHDVTLAGIDLVHDSIAFGTVLAGTTTLDGATLRIEVGTTQPHLAGGISFERSEQTDHPSLVGDGEIVFDKAGTMNTVHISGGRTLTVGPDVTIRTGLASGRIASTSAGTPGFGSLANQGTISAAGADRRIEITALDGLQNTGTMEAINGGQLLITTSSAAGLSDWVNNGHLRLDGGTITIIGQSFANSTGGEIAGTGTVDVGGTTFMNHGTVSPGLSAGVLTIAGDYQQSGSGLLIIEIGDVGHDKLSITGHAMLDGILRIELPDDSTPLPGDSFTIMTFGQRSGEFSGLHASTVHPGLWFELDYRPNELRLVAAALGGDANLDGRVDGEDFLIWQAGFGTQTGATWAEGDLNGDGRVDGEDFLIWQANFGSAAGSSAVTPEPAALVLLGLVPALLRRHRRPKHSA